MLNDKPKEIDKPPIGDPCNGCGLCCMIQVCAAGSYALGLVDTHGDRVDGPCPALEMNGDRLDCGLMRRPKHYLPGLRVPSGKFREAMAIHIGAGLGCDEPDDRDPRDIVDAKLDAIQARLFERHGARNILKAREIIRKARRS